MSFDIFDAEAKARVGRVLNEKWTLEELIGVGGMAAVYRAKHRNDAKAAVKILHPALARHPGVRERFLREGYAANHVEHRGAVQVLDDDIVKGGDDDGAAYLVMELLEGESLEQRAAREPPIDEQEFLTIAGGVLSVLEAAHAHGVIHRDLKPENIFLARDPEDGHLRVKVLDFGLACLTDGERTTGLGLALGTPSYMSPEQAAGKHDEIDGRTDLFALAATGFRLLTLRRIHEEEDVVRLVGRMANDPAPPIRSVCPTVSESVANIIDRALQFRREDRYPDAAAMRVDVQAAREVELPSSTRLLAAPPVEVPTELSVSDLESADDASVSEVEREPAPQRRRRSILPFVTVLMFVGIGVALVRTRKDPQDGVAASTNNAATLAVDAAVVDTVDAAPEVDADLASEPVIEIDAGDSQSDESVAPTGPSSTPSASVLPLPHPAPHPAPPKRPPHPPTAPTKRPLPAHSAPRKTH